MTGLSTSDKTLPNPPAMSSKTRTREGPVVNTPKSLTTWKIKLYRMVERKINTNKESIRMEVVVKNNIESLPS